MSDSDEDVGERPAKRQRFTFKTLKERVSEVGPSTLCAIRAPIARRMPPEIACSAASRGGIHRRCRRRMPHLPLPSPSPTASPRALSPASAMLLARLWLLAAP